MTRRAVRGGGGHWPANPNGMSSTHVISILGAARPQSEQLMESTYADLVNPMAESYP